MKTKIKCFGGKVLARILLLTGACGASAFSGSAVADVITVQGDSYDGSKTLTLINEKTVTSTYIKTGDALPSDVQSSVIFHLDASTTDGWEFTETNGRKFVTKIPSKNGNGRFLTCEQPTKPAMWAIASGPEYVADVAALNGKAMIDFGDQGSKRGLVFNADADHENTSGLFNIGSIIAVYGSERGGGWVLGGGGTGYFAHRGADPYDSGLYTPASPLFADAANNIAKSGEGWLDGFLITPAAVGFSENWQTLSLVFTAATGEANGLGINDARNYDWAPARSGGQQIAEMIFFNTLLTDAARASVEAYLMKKWFARNRVGANTRTELGELSIRNTIGTPTADFVTAEIPENETLAFGKVTGGYRGGAITKTGAGTLAIGDASGYAGAIKVQGGTLRFTQSVVPEALPTNSLLHLDASLENTLTVDASTQAVTAWRDVEGRTFKNQARQMLQTETAAAPTFYADPLLGGQKVVDFGAFMTSGKFMRAPEALTGIATAFLVIGAQEGGGHLLGANGYGRGSVTTGPAIDTALLANATAAAQSQIFIDRIAVDSSAGIPHRGWHVVALRVPGAAIQYLAGVPGGSMCGGQRLAEVVLYNRVLTEDEFNGAQAYLMKKWLVPFRPGTRATAHTVEMAKNTAIETEGDTVVRSLSVAGGGTLTKRGAGTLAVEEVAIDNLALEGGRVETRPRVDVADGPAADPVFHLDATKLDTMIFRESDGIKYVRQWHDVAGRNVAGENSSSEATTTLPWLIPETEAGANNNPVLNFGAFGSGRYLVFDRAVDTVRAAYVLLGTQDAGGGFILGSLEGRGAKVRYDFHRGGDLGANASDAILQNSANTIKNICTVFTNGAQVASPTSTGLTPNAYQLVEFHIASGAHASTLANDRTWRTGGQRLGEVILYDRALTEREKVATRNYLMQKWLNAAPQELPAAVKSELEMRTAAFEGESGLTVDSPTTVASVTGTGTFTKDGTNVLSVADMSAYAGSVSVESGTLALVGQPKSDYLPSGVMFHVDATEGLTCKTNNGEILVTSWKNLATSGACAGWSAQYVVNEPKLLESELNWLSVVDMGTFGSQKQMRFKNTDGADATMTNIKSIFWVIGSQNGGGFLLGGGGKGINFHRGGGGGSSHGDALLHDGASDSVLRENATWRINDKNVTPTSAGLSGGYDVVSMVVSDGSKSTASDGFAFDGRYVTDPTSYNGRTGGQRLAEVLIYDRVLSDEERLQVETYLQQKWGFKPIRLSDESLADFTVAAGATLALDGTSQTVQSVCGTGTIGDGTLVVRNGISAGTDATPGTLTMDGNLTFGADSVWTIDLAADAADRIDVGGTCTFATPQKVKLNNIDAIADQEEYAQVVMTAGAFVNAAALAKPVFVQTDLPPGKTVSLFSVQGENNVVLKVSKLGFIILIR